MRPGTQGRRRSPVVLRSRRRWQARRSHPTAIARPACTRHAVVSMKTSSKDSLCWRCRTVWRDEAIGSRTFRHRTFIWQTDSWHGRRAYGHRQTRKPLARQCVKSVQRGNGDGAHPGRTHTARETADTTFDPMQGRQATTCLGGRSRTATIALVADVRRKGMAVDGCASGKRITRLGGSAVHTTHAAQAEQLV